MAKLSALLMALTLVIGASAGPVAAGSAGTPVGTATIIRDEAGVPHVYANRVYDLFRGYGYAVGQDRLFQLEMSRRSTQGTVAEVLGAGFVAFDKDARSAADPDSIRDQLAALPREDRDIFDGYAAGLNEWLDRIATDPGRLMPKQFLDYGFAPSRWTAFDVAMVWVGTMAYRYSDTTAEVANYRVLSQLVAELGPQLGQATFEQVQWLEDPLAPTTVPRTSAVILPGRSGSAPGHLKPIDPQLRDSGLDAMRRNGGGEWPDLAPVSSNLWIVGKDRAVGAKSIMLNGPQFQWFNPGYVYGIGLHGAGYDFTGQTPFAYPAVIFGTNREISWGATAGPLNLVDAYQEQLDPANPRRYLFGGVYREMQVRLETIRVKGAADVSHEVLRTVHGPVTSIDPVNGTAYSKRRAYAGLEIQSLLAWVRLAKAHNFDEFRSLAAQFAITINWYYADKKGNIGYVSPGRLPDRPVGQDVRLPALGDGSMEWRGFLAPEANPMAYNPAQGYLANWNNQSAPGFNNDYGNWSVVDRDQELVGAFSERDRWTPEQMWALNERVSFVDLNLRCLRPYLAQAEAGLAADDPLRADIRRLLLWDGQTRDRDRDGSYDGPEPAMMRAWLPVLIQRVLADDLPSGVLAGYLSGIYLSTPVETRASIRPAAGLKLVYNAFLGPRAGVPQHVDFLDGQTPEQMVTTSLRDALAALRATSGDDPAGWLAPTAAMAYSYRNFLGVPQAGADEQLVGPEYANRGTANHLAVLGAGQDRLCLVAPPGQSGFVAADGTRSPYYADQLTLFAEFGCRDAHLSRRAVQQHTTSVVSLPPSR